MDDVEYIFRFMFRWHNKLNLVYTLASDSPTVSRLLLEQAPESVIGDQSTRKEGRGDCG